jgi:hypothetical protein
MVYATIESNDFGPLANFTMSWVIRNISSGTRRYMLQHWGSCAEPVTTTAQCSHAALEVGISQTAMPNTSMAGSLPLCFFSSNRLQFRPGGSGSGSGSGSGNGSGNGSGSGSGSGGGLVGSKIDFSDVPSIFGQPRGKALELWEITRHS